MKKWWRLTLSVLLLSLVVFGAVRFLGMRRAGEALPEERQDAAGGSAVPAPATGKGALLPVVTVETVKTSSLSKTVDLTGSVVPTRAARMASPAEGPMEGYEGRNRWVREGDRVTDGQILLRIGRNKAAEAQVAAARQALKEQELELRRLEQLVQAGAIPGSQLDAARSTCENARAQLSKAVENNEDYLVRAPWDGVVSKVHVTEGDYVAPRAVLIEIFDPASLVVQFAVPEVRSPEVRIGMPVLVQLDAHPGRTVNGKISRVYPQLDERMRARTVEATLSDPVVLIPGMFARIRVLLAQIPGAVTVPAESVVVTPKGEKMIFVLQDGKSHGRPVQTGIEEAGRVQILAGIRPGEQVIVAGNESLADGARVRVHGGGRL